MENEQVVTDVGTQEQVQSAEPVVQTESIAPVESQQMAPAEKMITSSQMSKIAAREAKQAAERATRETTAQYEAKIAEMQRSQQQAQQPNSVGGIQQQSSDEIRRQIREDVRQDFLNESRQAQAKQIESIWEGAMKAEMNSDPDFADLYDALNIEEQPHLVVAMAGMDNKVDMIRDLATNPAKYANILMLANSGSPKLAMMELNKLSQSIRVNQQAKAQPKVAAPLSQVKPSNIATDNGDMSVSDYRKQSWLRG